MPVISQESESDYKRRRSGFWTHEYRVANKETVWRCDLHGLEQAVNRIMMDLHEHHSFTENPQKYLDTRFGEGTAYAFFNRARAEGRSYIDLRTPDYLRGQNMATPYWHGIDTAAASGRMTGSTTATNTFLTTATALRDQNFVDHNTFLTKNVQRSVRAKSDLLYNKRYGNTATHKKLVKNLPFANGGDGVIETLQREFDYWAGKVQEELFHTKC